MEERKLMKIPQDKNYLKSLVKMQPVLIKPTNALRYNFEMPNNGATAVVDFEEDGTYSFRILPLREPKYVRLSKEKEDFEIRNLSNEAVIGLLEYVYKMGVLEQENSNVFSITGYYRYLKTFITGQPKLHKYHNQIIGKEYTFDFPNNYLAKVLHTFKNTFEITVYDNTGKGRVELAVIFNLSYSAKTLKDLTNDEVVFYLHTLYNTVESRQETLMDSYTKEYLEYFDNEWEKDNYINPDFLGYVNKNFWNNVKDLINTNFDFELPYERKGRESKYILPVIDYA